MARMVSTIPMGRLGESDAMAKATLFLASDDASYISGTTIHIDGGVTARRAG